jgi:hypothetical protein
MELRLAMRVSQNRLACEVIGDQLRRPKWLWCAHSQRNLVQTYSTLGGHYFAPPTPNAVIDRFEKRYSSSATGVGFYPGVAKIGTNDVNGCAFIGK